MTTSQRLTVRASEIRARLSEIAEIADLTDEHRSELATLRTEYRDTETQLQAAIVAEADAQPIPLGQGGNAEDRAYRDLCGRANIGSIFQALTERRVTEGAELEIQQHHKLNPHHVPLDLLRGSVREEHRAVTTAPANVATMQEAPIQPVFAMGDLAYLGVDMPSVPTGDAVFPVLTSRPTVRGPFTGSDDAAESDGAFDADLLAPERVQASFFYRRTDAARFSMMGESVARSAQQRIDRENRRGRDQRGERVTDRHEPGESQRRGGDDLRELHQSVLLRARRWALRGHAERSPGGGGLGNLRPRGQRLPLEQRGLQARWTA